MGNNLKIKRIPPTTVARLPLYLRCLQTIQNKNVDSISSFELAELTGHNAAQLRKDLSYLGEYGTRGVGYDVNELTRQIGKWLGATQVRTVAIFGAGHLGQALANYERFPDKGFSVVAIYDNDRAKIGQEIAGIKIKHFDEFYVDASFRIDVAVIATPVEAAQDVVDELVAAGVKSILNFAPTKIEVGVGVCVRNVDFLTELQIMGFHLASLDHGLTSDCC